MSDLSWELLLNGLTAACASFAGAYGAWKIASRAEHKKAVADEISAGNIAVGLCGSIMNLIIGLKRQLLEPKIAAYQASFQTYSRLAEAAWLGRPYRPMEVGVDIKSITMPYLALDDLQAAVAGIKGCRKAPMLLASVRQAVESLAKSVERHNLLAKTLKESGLNEDLYFGLLNAAGTGADESFPDVMLALDVQSADSIYFPELLAALVTRHGDDLVISSGMRSSHVSRILPAPDRFKAVMPNPADYADFEDQFRPKAKLPLPETIHWYMAHYEGLFQKLIRRSDITPG
jgi:hypothetical protein